MVDFIPKVVDSNHYHLWTDVLHARKLAKQSKNKWDRASYVRWSIISSWIVLEIACQNALSEPKISDSFKCKLNDAIKKKGFKPLNWGSGIWQKVINIQKKNNIIHRFQKEDKLFPNVSDANEAINTVREAFKDIYKHTNCMYPLWIEDDNDRGWDGRSLGGSANLTVLRSGAKEEDPESIKVYYVENGKEKLSAVLPHNADYNQEVDNILYEFTIPISKVFVIQDGQTIFSKNLNMRGI